MGVVVVLIILGIVMVDACPDVTSINGSCCKVSNINRFKFSAKWESRVYNITNFCGEDYCAQGYCDAVSDGGGWLVVQRRQDGSVNFDRPWVEYEEGFGNLDGEFWYGLRPLHCLTNQDQWQLRIDFTFKNGTESYLLYDQFAVGNSSSRYRLSISGFSGITVADPFRTHRINGMPFTTKDRDNDRLFPTNCALRSGGGWWYRTCTHFYLNRKYQNIEIFLDRKWRDVSFTEMKIRPHSCAS